MGPLALLLLAVTTSSHPERSRGKGTPCLTLEHASVDSAPDSTHALGPGVAQTSEPQPNAPDAEAPQSNAPQPNAPQPGVPEADAPQTRPEDQAQPPSAQVEASVPEPTPEVEAPPDPWAGESKRFHWGAGSRVHFGLLVSLDSPQLLSQTAIFGLVTLRTRDHEELRVQVELSGGIPDWVAVETNISYRWHLTPRFSVGAGLILMVGIPTLRTGIEVPFAIKIGASRRHELGFSFRATLGAFNNSTFTWYDFKKQAFAGAVEVTAGYTFIY